MTGIPEKFWKSFWNHPDPASLRLPEDADYVAGRMFNGPWPDAAIWASVHLPDSALEYCLTLRSTKPRTRDLIVNALNARRRQRSHSRDTEGVGCRGFRGPMPAGSVPDIAATKLKVVGDRGELRDYYDLMCIEEQGEADVHQMLEWYCRRYRLRRTDQSVFHIVRALGTLHDVADDPWLTDSLGDSDLLAKVSDYWRARQPQICRSFYRDETN
ncbi:MAG: hypothetical protein OXS33_03965 [bacterium]|nr:hypothetical protein [bacterium]